MNTADVVPCPDLVYIRGRVGQAAGVPAGHHQPWLTTGCAWYGTTEIIGSPDRKLVLLTTSNLNRISPLAACTISAYKRGIERVVVRARQTLDKDVSRLDYHTKFPSRLTVLTKLLRVSIYFRYFPVRIQIDFPGESKEVKMFRKWRNKIYRGGRNNIAYSNGEEELVKFTKVFIDCRSFDRSPRFYFVHSYK